MPTRDVTHNVIPNQLSTNGTNSRMENEPSGNLSEVEPHLRQK